MKQKIKFDKYRVYNKGWTYEVLLFPKIEQMWAYDNFYESGFKDDLMIDGRNEAAESLTQAFAILATDPSKIIYYPIRSGEYNYHLVMSRPELQLRQSDWFDIKPMLDKRHQTEKYVLHYDRKKLCDYYGKFIDGAWNEQAMEKKNRKIYRPKILGDTMFMAFPKNYCYQSHAELVKGLEKFQDTSREIAWWRFGYLNNDAYVKDEEKTE